MVTTHNTIHHCNIVCRSQLFNRLYNQQTLVTMVASADLHNLNDTNSFKPSKQNDKLDIPEYNTAQSHNGWWFVPTDGFTLIDYIYEFIIIFLQVQSVCIGLLVHGIYAIVTYTRSLVVPSRSHIARSIINNIHSVDGNGTQQSPYDVAIVGSGLSGIGMAIKLQQINMTNYVILERNVDVGGTWRDNSYPGCACDVPSNLYSYSFEQNPYWSRLFSRQGEIQEYLQNISKKYQLQSHTKYNYNVQSMKWNESTKLWSVTSTSGNTIHTRNVINAMGAFSDPNTPPFEGSRKFKGEQMHTGM